MDCSSTKNMKAMIRDLYREELASLDDEYLSAHSCNDAVIARHVEVFERYRRVLTPGTVLDWGCRHAVDACLIRACLRDAVVIHGCDVDEPKYDRFYSFAGLAYSRIERPYALPYPDDMFDTVIGSGVIEHVPDDGESLKELYRIVKPDGHVILTFIPNAFSYTEFIGRTTGRPHHRRRYTLRRMERMLLSHGFIPVYAGRHQFMPTLASGASFGSRRIAQAVITRMYAANGVLERVWPVNLFCSNLLIIGRKTLVV